MKNLLAAIILFSSLPVCAEDTGDNFLTVCHEQSYECSSENDCQWKDITAKEYRLQLKQTQIPDGRNPIEVWEGELHEGRKNNLSYTVKVRISITPGNHLNYRLIAQVQKGSIRAEAIGDKKVAVYLLEETNGTGNGFLCWGSQFRP